MEKLGEIAKQTNTHLEINGKRIAYYKHEIEMLVKNKNMFVLSSDAHKYENVGNVKKPMNFALSNSIPRELIANINATMPIKQK